MNGVDWLLLIGCCCEERWLLNEKDAMEGDDLFSTDAIFLLSHIFFLFRYRFPKAF